MPDDDVYTALAKGRRSKLVCVWRSKVWAVCEQYGRRTKRMQWQVIHVPSGAAVTFNQTSKSAAVALAKDLAEECPRMLERAKFGKVGHVRPSRNKVFRAVLARHGVMPLERVL